jgi:hypothetical protein
VFKETITMQDQKEAIAFAKDNENPWPKHFIIEIVYIYEFIYIIEYIYDIIPGRLAEG